MLNKNKIGIIALIVATVLILLLIVKLTKPHISQYFSNVTHKDRSQTEIDTLEYHFPENALNNLANKFKLDAIKNIEPTEFDFSQYPATFIVKSKTYSVYQFSDEFDFAIRPVEKDIQNRIQQDFNLAKEIATVFIEQENLSASVNSISLSYAEFNMPKLISGNICLYNQSKMYVTTTNLDYYEDITLVKAFLSELLKAIQEQTLGKIPNNYFNTYMSQVIATSICNGSDSNFSKYNEPVLYFVKAVRAENAINAFLFGFDTLINSGKMSQAEIDTYISLVQILNSSLSGQSNDLRQYLDANSTNDTYLYEILAGIAYTWETH